MFYRISYSLTGGKYKWLIALLRNQTQVLRLWTKHEISIHVVGTTSYFTNITISYYKQIGSLHIFQLLNYLQYTLMNVTV